MKKILTVTAVSASMILTGCATTGATGTNSTATKAGLGALGGAALGAAISKATGGEKTGRDAAIGAALGAGIGAYMGRQEAQLKAQTAGTGIEVTRDPVTNNINLAIPEAITFNVGKYDIKPSSYNALNQVASTLKQYDQTNVVVNGYASIEGNANTNQILSQNRAAAVANYLTAQGVNAARISAIGRGATTQFGSTYEPNRRVELTIIAPQSVN
ncbi:MAG: OmpA family protein [Moraxella sp.]|uniref:OmpA family protein n=1 Tax=Moraxella sp. TaxID=479 RepID=UPI0026DD9126|nr:OmpA family protein [Moraxella sp.]MDO4450139.1 OmpA family protein [Moraxella sp.]